MSLARRMLLLLAVLLAFVAADPPVYRPEEAEAYDTGEFGRVPTSRVRSNKGWASHLLRRTWDAERCERPDQYYFIAPHGILVGHVGPEIIDNNGHQVWFMKGHRTAYNFRPQWYREEMYLTWWSGDDQVRGHGEGDYYMLDKHYQLFKKVSAIGEAKFGDLHEFEITRYDTALITVYETIPWNLTAWGVANEEGYGYIRDCLFQEIDLDTNELLFEWRASEHVRLEDCYTLPKGEGPVFKNAWDWFHINSVEKDGQGNYLISSRYAHALFYVSGRTGEILWQVGGKNNSFKDLSGGKATNFARQHHARFQNGSRSITVFDNGEENNRDDISRGLKIAIDTQEMTVEVQAEAYHPGEYYSASQGSVQMLRGGNLFVGWGYAPAFTEFSADGKEVICDIQFGALHAGEDATYAAGAVESYRAYMMKWEGYPLDNPDVAFDGKEMYVSWNGATEVRFWTLDGTNDMGDVDEDWEMIVKFPRSGFESNVTVDTHAYQMLRLTALDRNSKSLGSWAVFTGGVVEKLPLPEIVDALPMNPVAWSIMLIVLSTVSSLMLYKAWCARAYLGSLIHEISPRGLKQSFTSPKLGFLVPKQKLWHHSTFRDVDDTEEELMDTERVALVSGDEKRMFTDED